MIEVSGKSVKFCTSFYGVDFLPTGTLTKGIRIFVPEVLYMIPYEKKILNYYKYSPVPELFNHHGDNVIVKHRRYMELLTLFVRS